MKQITYAGESVMTSDEIGTALVELTAALAKRGLAEAVVIPICDDSGADPRTAELVIGQGNDVLAVPVDNDVEEPDFAAEVTTLHAQLAALTDGGRSVASVQPTASGESDEPDFDYDLDLANFDGMGSGAGPK